MADPEKSLDFEWGEGPSFGDPALIPDSEEAQKIEQERNRRIKLNEERAQEELRVLLTTYGGRATLWRIMHYAGVYRGPESDPIDGWRQVGMADVGRRLLTWIELADIRAAGIMREEAIQRDKEVNHAG